MALVVPLSSSANVISNILFKVRRGIALSRNASQANAATGVMVDLPEKIDFEMTLLRTYQSPVYQRIVSTTASDVGVETKGVTSSETSSSLKISSDSDVKRSTETGSNQSLEQSTKNSNGSDQANQTTSGTGTTSDSDSSQETTTGKGNQSSSEDTQGTKTATDSEDAKHCTVQSHNANRYYDKFDTDTGELQGISG